MLLLFTICPIISEGIIKNLHIFKNFNITFIQTWKSYEDCDHDHSLGEVVITPSEILHQYLTSK